jgi:hypothetical protein
MGWFRFDDPDNHEGFVVGVVRDGEYRWRELGLDDRDPIAVTTIQIGCECGWRSQRLTAPLGTAWAPCCVFFPGRSDSIFETPEMWEDLAAAIWATGHMDPGRHGTAVLLDAQRAPFATTGGRE